MLPESAKSSGIVRGTAHYEGEEQGAMVSLSMSLQTLCINAIRTLAIDAVQQANSGHPGLPLDAAPMAYVIWTRFLRHNPRDPHWPNRDRFVFSPGHGSMLLYSL